MCGIVQQLFTDSSNIHCHYVNIVLKIKFHVYMGHHLLPDGSLPSFMLCAASSFGSRAFKVLLQEISYLLWSS